MKRLLIVALIVMGLMPALSKAKLSTHPDSSKGGPSIKRYKFLASHEVATQLSGEVTCQSCWVSEGGCVQCCGGLKHCPVVKPVVEPGGPIDSRPEPGPVVTPGGPVIATHAPVTVKCPAGCYPYPIKTSEEPPIEQ